MAGTSEGNKKVAAQLKAKHGIDASGRSRYHARIGSIGGENAAGGYFLTLKELDPNKLKAISSKGGKAPRKHYEGTADGDSGTS